MDPGSILACVQLSCSAVAICCKVGKALGCLVRGIHGSDDPLVLLHGEYRALRRNLKTVEAVLGTATEASRQSPRREPIINDIKESLRECKRHAGHFAEYLARHIDINNPQALTVTRIQGAINKLREEDLGAKRTQVHTIRMNVQIIISMITMSVGFELVRATKSGPERLITVRRDLESALEQEDPGSFDPDTGSVTGMKLRTSARNLLLNVSCARKDADSITLVQERPADFDTDVDPAGAENKLSQLLETGTIRSARTRAPAGAWLARGSMVSVDSTGTSEASSKSEDEDEDGSSDTEQSITDALQWFRGLTEQGRQHRRDGNTDEAVESLESALKYASRLSPTTEEQEELYEIHLTLASLYLERDDIETSETYMAMCKGDRRDTRNYRLLKSDIKFRQAGILFERSELAKAKTRCEASLSGRGKVLGEKSGPYFESVCLMARICWRMGEKPEAKFMISKLPRDVQEELEAQLTLALHRPSMNTAHSSKPISRTESGRPRLGLFSSSQKTTTTVTPVSDTISTVDSIAASLQSEQTLVTAQTTTPTPVTARPAAMTMTERPKDLGMPLSSDGRIRETLSRAGFSGDFDARSALLWAIDSDDLSVIRALLQGHQTTVAAPAPSKWSGIRRRSSAAITPVEKTIKFDPAGDISGRKAAPYPLIKAVERGRIDAVAHLLQHGAPVTIRNDAGYSPLGAAVTRGNVDIARQLLARHAPANDDFGSKRDVRRHTPLHIAVEAGHTELAALLLEHGARADARADKGITPLHIAASRGADSPTLLGIMLQRHGGAGAAFNVDAADEDGHTPLMRAARRRGLGAVAAVRALVAARATVDAANRMGRTALIMAVLQGEEETLRVLLEAGADPNRMDKTRLSALLASTRTGNAAMTRMMGGDRGSFARA